MHNLFEQTFSLLIIDLWIGQSDQVGNNRLRSLHEPSLGADEIKINKKDL